MPKLQTSHYFLWLIGEFISLLVMDERDSGVFFLHRNKKKLRCFPVIGYQISHYDWRICNFVPAFISAILWRNVCVFFHCLMKTFTFLQYVDQWSLFLPSFEKSSISFTMLWWKSHFSHDPLKNIVFLPYLVYEIPIFYIILWWNCCNLFMKFAIFSLNI